MLSSRMFLILGHNVAKMTKLAVEFFLAFLVKYSTQISQNLVSKGFFLNIEKLWLELFYLSFNFTYIEEISNNFERKKSFPSKIIDILH